MPDRDPLAEALRQLAYAGTSKKTWSEEAQVLRAILARHGLAVVSVEEIAWQPIETAPKDGTDIVLYAPSVMFNDALMEARVTVGRWTTDEECRTQIGDCGGECRCPEYEYCDPYWLSWDGGFTAEHPPTHWRPLPAPPADGGGA